jgi:hypothetical protein
MQTVSQNDAFVEAELLQAENVKKSAGKKRVSLNGI